MAASHDKGFDDIVEKFSAVEKFRLEAMNVDSEYVLEPKRRFVDVGDLGLKSFVRKGVTHLAVKLASGTLSGDIGCPSPGCYSCEYTTLRDVLTSAAASVVSELVVKLRYRAYDGSTTTGEATDVGVNAGEQPGEWSDDTLCLPVTECVGKGSRVDMKLNVMFCGSAGCSDFNLVVEISDVTIVVQRVLDLHGIILLAVLKIGCSRTQKKSSGPP